MKLALVLLSDVLLIGVCASLLWHLSNIVRYGEHLIQEPHQVVLWGEITFFTLVICWSVYSLRRKMSNVPSKTTIPIALRIPIEVHAIVQKRADRKGLKVSEYLRNKIAYDVYRSH